ncbi:hypothetical protein BDN70DRAFT_887630 [Pholiota conissans]|uniref:Uncharacterized protein n=1 Tax=Pholiota conissans TaxID=109636 RepID=A0A9P5YL86_9AGAR|nr:hypothetical protein BDN70DRAFT_887630 [Pholiota conissans]
MTEHAVSLVYTTLTPLSSLDRLTRPRPLHSMSPKSHRARNGGAVTLVDKGVTVHFGSRSALDRFNGTAGRGSAKKVGRESNEEKSMNGRPHFY